MSFGGRCGRCGNRRRGCDCGCRGYNNRRRRGRGRRAGYGRTTFPLQKEHRNRGCADDDHHQRHDHEQQAFKTHHRARPVRGAGGEWLSRRCRRMRLQFLGLLQGIIDQTHSAWCAPGGIDWLLVALCTRAAISQSAERRHLFDRATDVPVVHLVGVSDEGGQKRFVAGIVDDPWDSLAETV